MHSRASHVMGGEITWTCQGGNYVFTLVFYRDCNGADVNSVSETIRVWNHPTVTSITLPFASRTDISPSCNPVTGSPSPLVCGSGTSGGNGIGAIEKVVYRSAPIGLSGTPPAQGWIFTYENFSRSGAITNIVNPSSYGITLAAKMFANPFSSSGCNDSSPVFLQEPYFVSCAGEPYVYNMNPVDPDLDSIAVDFGVPFNNFPSGNYAPPTNPIPVPFDIGFSYNSPTPSPALSPGSIGAQVNNITGELSFTSFLAGNYVVKITVKSYRHGILISEVEREMQLVVMACNSTNNAPVITPPFSGGTSYTTTVNAGSLVNFNLGSSDLELLQDGSPQHNILSASGPMFGTGLSSTTGCAISPCATLNPSPLISGVQGVSTNFNWQTTCDHLIGADGNALDLIPYNFVFRIQDDYCDVPKVSYATVTVNVLNPGVIQATKINCIQTDAAGNVTINWNAVSDPAGTFVSYEIYSVQNGLLTTLPSIGTTNWTDPLITQQNDYYIAVVSGCNGNTKRYSDTISNIYLNLNNPSNGTAVLNWNDPSATALADMNSYYYVYREYPTGTWSLIDSVAYGNSFYTDTIDICQAFLNYKIVLGNSPCDFTSNSIGDDFEDMLTPDIPIISAVSIDTLTNDLTLNWNVNSQSVTYGYVVYTFDAGGFLIELDTVWGIGNTNYTYSPNVDLGPLSYTIAAFDSCLTSSVTPTYQTSAKADVHTTVFLESELFICTKEVKLDWSSYQGWTGIDATHPIQYVVFGKKDAGSWVVFDTTESTSITVSVEGLSTYCFFIKAISPDNLQSFSNTVCLSIIAPEQPAYHYLKVATVNGEEVQLQHSIDISGGITAISFERMNEAGLFEEIAQLPITSNLITYIDTNVHVHKYSYTYRTRIVDSCGSLGVPSNIARTILLSVQKDEVRMLTYLNWNSYGDWDGTVVAYRVYRDLGNGFDGPPLALVPPTQFTYQDDLNSTEFNGKVCYYVEAIEGNNLYDDPQKSASQVQCEVFEPILYVPNAFTPEGINPIFIPVISYMDPWAYRFTIFDRWGQVVFQTNAPLEGWNGTISSTGNMAETGTYIYMIEMHDGNNIEIIKRGFVSLLK